MVNLKELINIIPDLIKLFLPGFIFISIYSWLINKKFEISIIILWSLFISFINNSIANFITESLINISNTNLINIISILIGVFSAIIMTLLRKSKVFDNILNNLNHKSINSDIFDDIIDYEKKTILYIYLKKSNYCYMGTFCIREEKGLESWIVLVDYYQLDKNKEVIFDSNKVPNNYSIAINERDIERIECVYEDDSDTWKKLRGYDTSLPPQSEQEN